MEHGGGQSMLTAESEHAVEDHLLAVWCACGRTLISTTQAGLVAQVGTHWRLRHDEPTVVTPDEFVGRYAFAAWEGD
jgi:hypothetical protein